MKKKMNKKNPNIKTRIFDDNAKYFKFINSNNVNIQTVQFTDSKKIKVTYSMKRGRPKTMVTA